MEMLAKAKLNPDQPYRHEQAKIIINKGSNITKDSGGSYNLINRYASTVVARRINLKFYPCPGPRIEVVFTLYLTNF
jgi:hypothetical protein